MSLMELVESLCLSFRWRGHMLSTQSMSSTYAHTADKKNKIKIKPKPKYNFTESSKVTDFSDAEYSLSWRTYRCRSLYQILQLGAAELEADNIIEFVSLRRRRLIVTCPLGHGHLRTLLGVHIHHVYHASATWGGWREGGYRSHDHVREACLKQLLDTWMQATSR